MDKYRSTEGSGSAENKGAERGEQQAAHIHIDKEKRKDIASDAGVGKKDLAGLGELGSLSGRDNLAGGDSEGMDRQDTGQRTER